MKRLGIRISGLLLASILALMLSGMAYALEPEQDPAAGPPVEAVSNAADTQPAQQNAPAEQAPSNEQPKTAEQPAAPKQDQPAVQEAVNELSGRFLSLSSLSSRSSPKLSSRLLPLKNLSSWSRQSRINRLLHKSR